MRDDDYAKLLEDLEHELLSGAGPAGVLGLTRVTLRLLASLAPSGLSAAVEAIYAPQTLDARQPLRVPVRPFPALSEAQHGVLVVAADEEKEDLLRAALPFIQGAPKVIVAGYGHLAFRDPLFDEELTQLLVPSLANGYPLSLVHLYQCLASAALDVARERTVPGGAIVFDHFTGTGRFRYTLGERIAGRVLLDDPRYFHLHGTGVFYRQPSAHADRAVSG